MRVLEFQIFLGWFVVTVLIWPIYGVSSEGYQKGSQYASQLKSPPPLEVSQVPNFKGTDLPETQYDHASLGDKASKEMGVDRSAGQLLRDSSDKRPYFKIDPQKNPLLKEAHKIVNKPEDFLKAEQESLIEKDKILTTLHTCLEPAEPFEISTTNTLTHVPLIEKKRESSIFNEPRPQHDPSCKDHQWLYCNRYMGEIMAWVNNQGKTIHKYYKREILYSLGKSAVEKELTPWELTTEAQWKKGTEENRKDIHQNSRVPYPQDFWYNETDTLEAFADKGYCSYGQRRCVSGKSSRLIHNTLIERPCWKEVLTYKCGFPGQNTCKKYTSQGCRQISSQCREKIGKKCILFEQTFECQKRNSGLRKVCFKGQVPYCLDGNCNKVEWTPNKDMGAVFSKLAIFKELSKDMNAAAGKVFKGTEHSCAKHCVNFTDCCKVKGSGWGVSMGLSSCSEQEKLLAQLRGSRKCVFVGTYCAENFLGVCLRKKSTFCCFETKLARIIHEQGRTQLGINWGSAKHPYCRALTIDELTRLDFEKLNLSELTDELLSKVTIPSPSKILGHLKQEWKMRLPSSKDSSVSSHTLKDIKKLKEEL